jgi:hypothetical protein
MKNGTEGVETNLHAKDHIQGPKGGACGAKVPDYRPKAFSATPHDEINIRKQPVWT